MRIINKHSCIIMTEFGISYNFMVETPPPSPPLKAKGRSDIIEYQ